MNYFKIIGFTTCLTLLCNCTPGNNGNPGDGYDRSAMLIYWSDYLIIPAYESFADKTDSLKQQVDSFMLNPNLTNLNETRSVWTNAYKAFQYVGFYEFGPADQLSFLSKSNIYPCDTTNIRLNITSANTNFSLLSTYDEQGLPAMDFMLNGLGDDNTTLAYYSTHPQANLYKNYLVALANELDSLAGLIHYTWISGYRDSYIASNGNSGSSSTNLTVNSFVKYFEKNIRAGKVGIPSGIYSSGTLYPGKVEAYYMPDLGKILLDESVVASKQFFNGNAHYNITTTGPCLNAYLNYLNVQKDGELLSVIINDQFDASRNKIALLMPALSNQVNTDHIPMVEVFDELQQNVIYFKTDMMPALNITVDYVDADGD
jgi:hypothetical protein